MGGIPKLSRLIADRSRLQRTLSECSLIELDDHVEAELKQFVLDLERRVGDLDEEIALAEKKEGRPQQLARKTALQTRRDGQTN